MLTVKFDRDKVRLGVTPTLWWNDDFPSIDIGISFEQCISEMALAGFQGCSVGHKYPTDTAVLQRALDAARPACVASRGPARTSRSRPWSRHDAAQLPAIAGIHQGRWADREMVVAELGGSAHPLPVAVFANKPTFDDEQWDDLCRGPQPARQDRRRRGDAAVLPPPHGHRRDDPGGDRSADGLHRPGARCTCCLDTGHAAFAGDDPLYAALRPTPTGSGTCTSRTFGRRWWRRVARGVAVVPAGDRGRSVHGARRRLDRLRADPAGAWPTRGYEGWLVVEAEQDPAKAEPAGVRPQGPPLPPRGPRMVTRRPLSTGPRRSTSASSCSPPTCSRTTRSTPR